MTDRSQKRLARVLQHVVRTVAEPDLLLRNSIALREGDFERKPVPVGIARDTGDRVGDRLPYLWTRSARVLVRSELHDRILGEAVLARELIDRFARYVGGNASHVFRRARRRGSRGRGYSV